MHGMYSPSHPDGRAETGEPTTHTDWRTKVPGTRYASERAATKMALAVEFAEGFHTLDPESQLIALAEDAEEEAKAEEILGNPTFGIITAEEIIRTQRGQLEQEIQGTAGTTSSATPFGPADRATRVHRRRNTVDYGADLGRRAAKRTLRKDFIGN